MSRYTRAEILETPLGKNYQGTTKYPDIPLSFNDIYVYTDEGDRFDILAQQYYQDSSLWWLISAANPQLTQMSMYPPLGIQIRIPMNVGNAISLYNRINESY
jgi:phage tail protein X|tara:strand:- start:356 stop:661 length:306 start_codon:yes stop_codon:yes gene_type:complete